MKKVITVEVGTQAGMLPLVSGYLQAYAQTDPLLRNSFTFDNYTAMVNVDHQSFTSHLIKSEADVYAFSCYMWNISLIMAVVPELVRWRPSSHVILGGPQVHHGERYLKPHYQNVSICNGEGEITFAEFLRELTEPDPDLSKVKGISFRSNGNFITTDGQSRLATLDDIPSPFLSGLFKDRYHFTIFETNRGCPFRCGFCYWGAATNDRVFKFDEARLTEEIDWISKAGIPVVYIADANWGMLDRDLRLSRHIANCKQKHNAPSVVLYNAAKNRPDRAMAVTEILHSGGVQSTQPVSLQSMSDHALQAVDRENIKKSVYIELQRRLNELNFGSMVELIWPLPGETLASFRSGIEQLCRMGNNTIIAYPHLLLPNTPLSKKRQEFGLITERVSDGRGEADVVIQTSLVSQNEVRDGYRYWYSVHLLHNACALNSVASYLDGRAIEPCGQLFEDFAEFCRTVRGSRLVEYIEDSVRTLSCFDSLKYHGTVIHYALHVERAGFDKLLHEFMSSQSHWNREEVRFLYEVDRLLKPYVYSSTPLDLDDGSFEMVKVRVSSHRAYDLEIPERFQSLFIQILSSRVQTKNDGTRRYRLDHARDQPKHWMLPNEERIAAYCWHAVTRVNDILPTCVPITETARSTGIELTAASSPEPRG
jgi:radical SAM superfamily enzyme YgiQ (UPF0313 family)